MGSATVSSQFSTTKRPARPHNTKDNMKAFDNGCFFSVQCSQDDVDNFKSSWPCNGMPSKKIWFQWEKSNGDLVDMNPSDWEERGAWGEAVIALADDAKDYGKKQLHLTF